MKSFQKFLVLFFLPITFICFVTFVLNWDIANFKNPVVNVLISGFFIIVSFSYVYVFEKLQQQNRSFLKSIAIASAFVFLAIFIFGYSATFFMTDYIGPKIPFFQATLFISVFIFYVAFIRIFKAIQQNVKLDFPNEKSFYLKITAGISVVVFIILMVVNADSFFWDGTLDYERFIATIQRLLVISLLSVSVSFLSLYLLNKIFFGKNLVLNITITTIVTSVFNTINMLAHNEISVFLIVGYCIVSLFVTVTIAAVVIYSNALSGKDFVISKLTTSFSKKEAEYLELKNQINPHFLFNNLNTLIAFIEINPQKAIAFGHHLSNVYRHYLKNQSEDFVSLTEELAFIKEYLEIYKAKFESGFTFEITGNNSADQYILSVSLQELTDNVFKHNNLEEDHPMSIVINVNDKKLVFANSVHPKTDIVSNNSGLKNISKRYKILTGKDITVEKTDTSFSVSIPILTTEKA
ncbi:MAG: histidine kinase [Flavobacterium sp.]|nr:histidine kinase [Flavobacterium sp.]